MPLLRSEYDAMSRSLSAKPLAYLPNFTARKVQAIPVGLLGDVPDSLAAWATRYLALAVVGVRSEEVTKKIALHLDRFVGFFLESYDHDRISACLRRDVLAWQKTMVEQGQAPATVNNLLASLSAFTTWVAAQAPTVFPVGDPAKGVRELGLLPLEPRALTPGPGALAEEPPRPVGAVPLRQGSELSRDHRRGAGPRPRASVARPRDRLPVLVDGLAPRASGPRERP
jgi:hypothetical protein